MDFLVRLLIAAVIGLLVRWIAAQFIEDRIAVLLGLLAGVLVFVGRLG
jgi:hypothetical protein